MTFEALMSIVALMVSIMSIYITFQQEQRTMKIQLFELRIEKYFLINTLVQTVTAHKSMFEKIDNPEQKMVFSVNTRLELETLTNNTVFNEIYHSVENANYDDYKQEIYASISKIRQTAAAIPLVFRDDEYSLATKKAVEAYIDVVEALYNQQVFSTRRRNIKEIPTDTNENIQKDCAKALERNKVIEKIKDMLSAFDEVEKCHALEHIENQVNLSQPKS